MLAVYRRAFTVWHQVPQTNELVKLNKMILRYIFIKTESIALTTVTIDPTYAVSVTRKSYALSHT